MVWKQPQISGKPADWQSVKTPFFMNTKAFKASAAAMLQGMKAKRRSWRQSQRKKKPAPHGVGAGFIEQSEYNGLGVES